MSSWKKYRGYGVVIAILVAIKWGGLPWLAWQDAQLQWIDRHQRQLAKMTALLEQQDDLQAQVKTLQAQLEQSPLWSRLGREQDLSAFRLARQQQLEALASRHQVKLSGIGWEAESQYQEGIVQLPVRLRLKGHIGNVVAFGLAVQQASPLAIPLQFNYRVLRGQGTSLQVEGFLLLGYLLDKEAGA